jgi:predicted CXXCH cytochrome family protein
VPVTIAEDFRTDFPTPYPLQGGKAEGSWHWSLGGHLSAGKTGAMVCGTCHAVHGEEASAPRARLLAVAPVNDVANLFCEGCHDGERQDKKPEPPRPNPGGTKTARTYHAVDDDEANGAGRFLEIKEPEGWPFGGGDPKRLLCTTCHVAHNAWVQTPLLRTSESPGFCEDCHEKVSEWHHVVGETANTGCGAQLPAAPYRNERTLSCARCHEAHNAGFGKAREADYVPLLIAPAVSGELCAICHPSGNPTCTKDTARTASHFLGDPALPTTYANRQ